MSKQVEYTETFKASKLMCEQIPGTVEVRATDAEPMTRLRRLEALAADNSDATAPERELASELARKLAKRHGVTLPQMEVRITGPETLVNKIKCHVSRGGVLRIDGPAQAAGEVLAVSLLQDLFGSNITEQVHIVVLVPGSIEGVERLTVGDRAYLWAPPRESGSSRS